MVGQINASPTMNNSIAKHQTALVEKLKETDSFKDFQDAFRLTTGCGFHLVAENEHKDDEYAAYPFLRELCIPVEANQRVFARLCAEPLRIRDLCDNDFCHAASLMLDNGGSAAELRAARGLFDHSPMMTAERAEAIETMLRMFSLHLGEAAERLFLQTVDCDPLPVQRAKKFILQNLTEPLSLEDVAAHVGVSPFHFCKIFKRATGLTFTNYVNNARIEQAKRLLQKPQSRVTEVAYDVGFQSLSQFNRSFRRHASLSPTEYRVKQHQAACC